MSRYEFDVVRDGAKVRKLDIAVGTTPTISFTASAEIKRTLSLVCPVYEEVNWLKDEVQARMITDTSQEIPLGRFSITTYPIEIDSTGIKTMHITGYDYGYKVRNLAKLENAITIAAGVNVTEEIQRQLIASGVERCLIERSNETLTTAHCYDLGTTRYQIINELLEEINYRDLWFDGKGNAVVQPWSPVDASKVKHKYRQGQNSIIVPDMTIEDDVFNAANVFIEIAGGADLYTTDASGNQVALRAEAINNSPNSALSVMRRGIRVPSIETLDTITSLDALQTRANNRMLQSMMGSRVYTWSSGAHLEENEHGLNDGVFLERDGIGLLEEQDWSISCTAGGLMRHTGRRVFYT